jgi:hypothetical protein
MKGGNEPFTVFAVTNSSQSEIGRTATSVLSFGDNETNVKERWDMRIRADARYGSHFKDANVGINNDPILKSANKHAVITMSYDGGGAKNPSAALIYENGASIQEKTADGPASGDAAIAQTPMLHIGSRPDDGNLHEGDIAEVIIYTRVLSAAERQQVEAYLADKWMDEPYYTDCIDAENSGETIDATFTIDTDGYNGPRAPFSVSCDFAPYSNLVAWWKLDETTGASAADSTGTNTATLAGGTLPGEAGRHGGAMLFDGTDDTVTASGYKGISGTASRTITAWIKSTASGTNMGIVSWGGSGSGKKMVLRTLAGSNALRIEVEGGSRTGSSDIIDGKWHFVVMTLATGGGSPNITDAKLYVDGVEEVSYTDVGQAVNTGSASDVVIGNSLSSSYFDGSIDDVRIYDKALSDAEVLELYKQGER